MVTNNTDHLIKLRGKYHYKRRVPTALIGLVGKKFVQKSTGTSNRTEAGLIAREIDAENERYWATLRSDDDGGAKAEHAYDKARKRANAMQLDYRTADELAAGPLEKILRRVEQLEQNGLLKSPPAVEAVLGGVEKPKVLLSSLFERYEAINRADLRRKAPDQLRKWRNPHIKAVNNLIALIGDKPIDQITRSDALSFREWWQNRVVGDRMDPGSANKDIGHLNKMINEVSDYLRLELERPFAGYAHVNTLRGDPVLPELLGMTKVVSENALRRALLAMPEEEAKAWLEANLQTCVEPLLTEPYIMDMDSTVKPIYGRQEGAVVGYNPTKPGRPSHVHHTYMVAGLRLVMGVETLPGNASTGSHAAPGLWALLDRLPAHCQPSLLRGDVSFGTEKIMAGAERRGRDYLFKLRLTKNVRRLINRTFSGRSWQNAGHGWQGCRERLRLDGWSRERDVVILRRRIKDDLAQIEAEAKSRDQLRLSFTEIEDDTALYEYAVLVTSLQEKDIYAIAQLYRDRADCENVFDELKNQWGWGGFTTQDLARCRLTALMVALVFNWWNIYCRLADGDSHLEATTSRPLLLSGVGQRIEHGRQTTLKVTSAHAKAGLAAKMLGEVTAFLRRLVNTAEQLTIPERWSRILAHAARAWLGGRPLKRPPLLAPT